MSLQQFTGPFATKRIQTKYMSLPVSTVVTRFAYGMSQMPRVAWYVGHGLALRRLAEAARRREGSQSRARRRPHTDAPVPARNYIYAETIRLFMQDLANVEVGIYPVPDDHDGSLRGKVKDSLRP